jgi:hypothetical protein
MVRKSKPTEAVSERMATRSKNATTHPGAILIEATRIQRPKDIIQKEKQEKKERKDAAEQAKATAKTGADIAAQLQAADMQAAANNDKKIPRRRQQQADGMYSLAPEQ